MREVRVSVGIDLTSLEETEEAAVLDIAPRVQEITNLLTEHGFQAQVELVRVKRVEK